MNNVMCFYSTFSNSYEKWDTYNLVNNLHLCVFLWFFTYDGDPPFTRRHKSIVTLLYDPKDFSSSLSKSSSSLDENCNGVFGSSSSCFNVPSLCPTNASWFALYFKIGNSYSSFSRSLSFSSHFLLDVSTDEYWSSLFVPNRYFAWHNKQVL